MGGEEGGEGRGEICFHGESQGNPCCLAGQWMRICGQVGLRNGGETMATRASQELRGRVDVSWHLVVRFENVNSDVRSD